MQVVSMEVVDRARETLERVVNGVLATVSPDGRLWNSPVFVAFDAAFRFYWSSHVDAVHSRNIASRPDVFFVVFDSTQPDESGRAVYLRATAHELIDLASIEAALMYLARRKNQSAKPPAQFIRPHPCRVYQAVPDMMWTNVVKHENGHYFDERVVLDLLPRSHSS
jgi:hypothetical protein